MLDALLGNTSTLLFGAGVVLIILFVTVVGLRMMGGGKSNIKRRHKEFMKSTQRLGKAIDKLGYGLSKAASVAKTVISKMFEALKKSLASLQESVNTLNQVSENSGVEVYEEIEQRIKDQVERHIELLEKTNIPKKQGQQIRETQKSLQNLIKTIRAEIKAEEKEEQALAQKAAEHAKKGEEEISKQEDDLVQQENKNIKELKDDMESVKICLRLVRDELKNMAQVKDMYQKVLAAYKSVKNKDIKQLETQIKNVKNEEQGKDKGTYWKMKQTSSTIQGKLQTIINSEKNMEKRIASIIGEHNKLLLELIELLHASKHAFTVANQTIANEEKVENV